MSALAMILTAAIVVPGDGPEKPSMEIVHALDLSGEWEGEWRFGHQVGSAKQKNGIIRGRFAPRDPVLVLDWIKDENNGRCRYVHPDGDWQILGIYRQDGDRLMLCFGRGNIGRPSSFYADDGQHLLILHRVKPRK